MVEVNSPDLILTNGKFTTLDPSQPEVAAVAIASGRFTAVGSESLILPTAGPRTRVIDCAGRRVIPGLADNHNHVIRGGLNYNMELRWDGVPSLADAMRKLKEQVARTPAPQWVRVVGGFTDQQFAERRLPTLDEINAVAPETPVFILHLYDRALLNAAALRAVGYTKETPDPPGGRIARDGNGNPTGLLIASPNAGILYATLGLGPKLSFDSQLNSTRHFMRELNRLGVTSVIDAGGGSQNYPDDYGVIQKLHGDGQLTLRFAYNLFTQRPGRERDDFLGWTAGTTYGQGDDFLRLNGAGEMLVFSAADFEDFRQPRPDMPVTMEDQLEGVIRVLAENPGRGGCTRPTTKRSVERSTSSRRCTVTFPSLDSTGSSTMPKRSASIRSSASRRSRVASRCSTEWHTRANTSRSVTEPRPRRTRRRCVGSSPAV